MAAELMHSLQLRCSVVCVNSRPSLRTVVRTTRTITPSMDQCLLCVRMGLCGASYARDALVLVDAVTVVRVRHAGRQSPDQRLVQLDFGTGVTGPNREDHATSWLPAVWVVAVTDVRDWKACDEAQPHLRFVLRWNDASGNRLAD